MEINWFPGHMVKTKRLIQEKLALVDLVFETCDARIPISSRNPEVSALVAGKPRILLLTKSDLADPAKTARSLEALRKQGDAALPLDLIKQEGIKALVEETRRGGQAVVDKALRGGRLTRPLRIMVVGIPNSGKSTLINCLAGRRAAKVEDRPGVTRSLQWIKTPYDFELMDMPGILWPDLGSWEVKLNLAATGAIKDDILDVVELAFHSLNRLIELYPREMLERFGKAGSFFDAQASEWRGEESVGTGAEGEAEGPGDAWTRFESIARLRGCLRKGGKADEERFAKLLLSEFRQGKIGRMSLEVCDEQNRRSKGGEGE